MSPKSVEKRPVTRTNIHIGNRFLSREVYDLSQRHEGPPLSEEPVDADRLTEEMNQLIEDSKPYWKPPRKHKTLT